MIQLPFLRGEAFCRRMKDSERQEIAAHNYLEGLLDGITDAILRILAHNPSDKIIKYTDFLDLSNRKYVLKINGSVLLTDFKLEIVVEAV